MFVSNVQGSANRKASLIDVVRPIKKRKVMFDFLSSR